MPFHSIRRPIRRREMKRLFLLILLVVLCLSSCTLFQEEPDDTDYVEYVPIIVVAESTPDFDAVQKNCFFGYDSWGYLWKIRWNDTADIEEGQIYDIRCRVLSENNEATGLEPRYIASAFSVYAMPTDDFSAHPKVVSLSHTYYNYYFNEEYASIFFPSGGYYYQPPTDKTTMSVVLPNGTRQELVFDQAYVNTFENYVRYGTLQDEIFATFDLETDRVRSIQVKEQKQLLPSPQGTECYYQNWIGEWISRLGINDFSEYQLLSCETLVSTDVEEPLKRDHYRYLYTTLKENEKIYSYTFKYVRYIDGFPTSDTVSVVFYYSACIIALDLGTHSFGDVESLSVDEEALMAEAEAFVRNSLKAEYEILQISTYPTTLRCCNGRFGMEIEVSCRVRDQASGSTLYPPIRLLVFLD